MAHKKPVVLVILDGFGHSDDIKDNAIYHAHTPNIDRWMGTYPNTTLCASGECVGLLPSYIGNSEVGHMTIGCGRVVPQPVRIIHQAIKDQSFFKNKILLDSLDKVRNSTGRLHIMGLLSDAGVHGHIDHLYAFLRAAKQKGIESVYVHGFLDGRDVGPKTAIKYVTDLCKFMQENSIGKLASLHGRFYAMDRDKNWERTKATYDLLIGASLESCQYCPESCPENWEDIIQKSYANNITDEFFVPVSFTSDGAIKDGDGVVFFNFRPDRARQLTQSFADNSFDSFEIKDITLSCFVTPVLYANMLHTDSMFNKEVISNTLKDILISNGKSIFSIAETEKYAHITYFFNGGREKTYDREIRVLIKSIPAKDYVHTPHMSAAKITDAVLNSLQNNTADFYLINYANADMVGHSGNFEATKKAIECLDTELKKLYDIVIEKMDGILCITADHGNAEEMFNVKTNQPHTAHTTNPVPFIFIKKGLENSNMRLELQQLADIAPFILENMGCKKL